MLVQLSDGTGVCVGRDRQRVDGCLWTGFHARLGDRVPCRDRVPAGLRTARFPCRAFPRSVQQLARNLACGTLCGHCRRFASSPRLGHTAAPVCPACAVDPVLRARCHSDVEAAAASPGARAGSAPAPVGWTAPAGTVMASPAAKKAAKANGVALPAVTGSGPYGRITERDVLVAAGKAPPAPKPAAAAVKASRSAPELPDGPVKLTSMQVPRRSARNGSFAVEFNLLGWTLANKTTLRACILAVLLFGFFVLEPLALNLPRASHSRPPSRLADGSQRCFSLPRAHIALPFCVPGSLSLTLAR
jgi:hypothetical protein